MIVNQNSSSHKACILEEETDHKHMHTHIHIHVIYGSDKGSEERVKGQSNGGEA